MPCESESYLPSSKLPLSPAFSDVGMEAAGTASRCRQLNLALGTPHHSKLHCPAIVKHLSSPTYDVEVTPAFPYKLTS